MRAWRYIIKGNGYTMTTTNEGFAEKKRKQGYFVLCQRDTNIHTKKNAT